MTSGGPPSFKQDQGVTMAQLAALDAKISNLAQKMLLVRPQQEISIKPPPVVEQIIQSDPQVLRDLTKLKEDIDTI